MNHILSLSSFSAAGKDSIATVLSNLLDYKIAVSVTNRPKRIGEKEGIHYYFKTDEEMKNLLYNNRLVEYRIYNTIDKGKPAVWYYGIEKKEIDLNKNNYIVIVDYNGLKHIKDYYGNNVISIFIDVDEDSRKYRAIARDKNFDIDEWNRRNRDDYVIFNGILNEVNHIVRNYDFKSCINEVIEKLKGEDMEKFFNQYASY